MLRAKGTAGQPADTVMPFPWLAGRTSLHCPLHARALTAPTKGDVER